MTYSIRQLCDEHGLTLRALRFYETRGLLSPSRGAGHTRQRRQYSEADAMRLREVLRGVRYGLTLKEIAGYLENGPTGPWLHVPAARAGELAGELDERAGLLMIASEELREIASGRPVGAFSGQTGASGPERFAKRAPSSPAARTGG